MIANLDPTQVGYGAFVVLIVLLIVRGWLVTPRQLRDVMEQRDYWRSAWEKESVARQHSDSQVDELLRQGQLTIALLEGLQRAARERDST